MHPRDAQRDISPGNEGVVEDLRKRGRKSQAETFFNKARRASGKWESGNEEALRDGLSRRAERLKEAGWQAM